jgi:hypothetical protein
VGWVGRHGERGSLIRPALFQGGFVEKKVVELFSREVGARTGQDGNNEAKGEEDEE